MASFYCSYKRPLRRLNKVALILLPVLISSALSGCLLPKEEEVLAPPLKEPPKVVYDLTEVKKSSFELKTTCIGYLESSKRAELSFKDATGRLKGVYVKEGDLVKQGDLLAELVSDKSVNGIKEQEIQVEKARMTYEMSVSSGDSKFNVRRAQLDMRMEELKLDDLKESYGKTRIVAPFDGVINYVTTDMEGDFQDAYKQIVTVAAPGETRVMYSGPSAFIFVNGADIQLKAGGKAFSGKVVGVPSDAPSDANEKEKSTVYISVEKLPDGVKIGDSVDISYIRVKKDNVIVVPKNYVHTVGMRSFIHIMENGQKKERDIETGESNDTEIIISKGLSEGEQLVEE